MNGKRAFVISSPYLVTGFVKKGAFVYVTQNKMWQQSLSRGHSSAPSVPNLLPIYNNHSRVCCLLLQISAHRCGVGVTASRAAWTQHRILIVFQPNRTRCWAGWGNTSLKGLVAITWASKRPTVCMSGPAQLPPSRGSEMTRAFCGLIPPVIAKVSRLDCHCHKTDPLNAHFNSMHTSLQPALVQIWRIYW